MVEASEDRSRCKSAEPLNDAMERAACPWSMAVSPEFVVVVGIGDQDTAIGGDVDRYQTAHVDRVSEPLPTSIVCDRRSDINEVTRSDNCETFV